jgi:hypothetical protein
VTAIDLHGDPPEFFDCARSLAAVFSFVERAGHLPQNDFQSFLRLRDAGFRHCEERSDEAIHVSACRAMDCFASLAMTAKGPDP